MSSRTKVGAMRHRVHVQEPIEAQDDTGQPIVTWQTVLENEPADFMPTGGMESMRGRQLEAGTKAIFRVRYKPVYTTQMRVLFDDVGYGITYINKVDGLRKFIELVATT